jgi:hypothetical protein
VNLNEAVIEVLDNGFDTDDETETKVRIYDYLPNLSFEQDEESRSAYDYKDYKKVIENAYLQSYGGNEFTLLRIHDAVRNYTINSYDFVNIFEQDFIRNHRFKKENSIVQDGEELFVISFRQAIYLNDVVGKVYISKTDYAIHKMEYTLYDHERKLENRQKNRHGTRFEPIFEVITEYKRMHGKMFPNYISFFNNFKAQKAPTFVMQGFYANAARGCFVVKFNDFVDVETGSKKSNYDLNFQGKKIKFDTIKVRSNRVELYPKMDENFEKVTKVMYSYEYKGKKDVPGKLGLTNIKNLSLTAMVNEIKYENYKQYREFFVQEVKPNGSVLTDTLFMNKNAPIFKDQPMLKPDNFDEYWMNTPLKNVDN